VPLYIRLLRLLSKVIATSVCLIAGCGTPSNAPTQSVSVPQSPEKVCEARSRVDLQGDPEGAALWRAALYDDCLVQNLTDTKKIANERRQGQLEAFKGYLAMGARRSEKTELIKTKLIASADLDMILGFFELLKASNKFSEVDLQELDRGFPHLGIAEAFHAYEHGTTVENVGENIPLKAGTASSVPYGPLPADAVEFMNTTLHLTPSYRCWMKIGNRFQEQTEFHKFNELSVQMRSDVLTLKNHSFATQDEAMKAMRLTSASIVVYSRILDDPSLAQVKDFCAEVPGVD